MFDATVTNDIKALCQGKPYEVCGYVLNGKVVECENTAHDPTTMFEMEYPDEFDAIFHSHPGGPFYPSSIDMKQQSVVDKPWAIFAHDESRAELFWFGDGVPTPDLINRPFRHGVTDCYELVRDFYRLQHNISLPTFPRDWEWWDDGENLYEEGFRVAGFEEISLSDMLPGDAFLASIRSKTPNHAAVYLGNDLILHHTTGQVGYDPSRPAKIEPAARWLNYLDRPVRYTQDQIDRTVGQGLRF